MKNTYSLIAFLLLSFGTIYADIPRIISYQGVLIGADGKPQSGMKNLEITIVSTSGTPHPSNFKHTESFILQGGLFYARLGKPPESNMDFPILEGDWNLKITEIGTLHSYQVALFSSPYALNIADNVVTSVKIKDGEVKSQDLDAMGATVDGQTLVYRAGAWRAETQVVPLTIPVGTVMAYMGDGSDLSALQSNGWYLCDNRQISTLPGLTSQEKTDLTNIFTRAGNPSPGNLPDLRGMFLRGADNRALNNADPDFNKRSGSGKKIGSVQGDSVGRHTHNLRIDNGGVHNHRLFLTARTQDGSFGVTGGRTSDGDDGYAGNNAIEPSGLHTHSGFAEENSGSETRPKNVYVNYIIKVK